MNRGLIKLSARYRAARVAPVKDDGPQLLLWVHLPDGTSKSYLDASGQETLEYLQSICPIKGTSANTLELACIRFATIARALEKLDNRNYLLGGPGYMEKHIEGWEKLKALLASGEKKEGKE